MPARQSAASKKPPENVEIMVLDAPDSLHEDVVGLEAPYGYLSDEDALIWYDISSTEGGTHSPYWRLFTETFGFDQLTVEDCFTQSRLPLENDYGSYLGRWMVWIVEKGGEVHPVLSAAAEESDEIDLKLRVFPGSLDHRCTLSSLRLETETGMHTLVVNRGGRWAYRPRDTFALKGGDSLLAPGALEGRKPLAELFGQEVEELRE
jgi:hypothetical protein